MFSEPNKLSKYVTIRMCANGVLVVTYELDNSNEGQAQGHLTFALSPRVFGADEFPPYDSQEGYNGKKNFNK